MPRTLLRRTAGGMLLLLTVPLALGAGALAFLGTAAATATIPLLSAAGLAALAAVAFLLGWPVFALLRPGRRPFRAAGVLAGVLALATAGLAAVTVFQPLPPPPPCPRRPAPATGTCPPARVWRTRRRPRAARPGRRR
ncbi:hypothetical protein [Phytohabitans rumicis]|uniref:Uncharacterized protein n=1 Tax=Phytohabitans rumicis TaxID=1076125 RepID=A0A6V8LM46_9ACTN|nr:hypothetical protein [Phytohabitans rumicis]GFJ96081.1 hypothetical protein Prum_097230 [Phytohabitans rumicis]